MPHGWIILDKPLAGNAKKGAILSAILLTGCGLLPRTSTGNDLLDAVVIREDPIGDCVTVGGQTFIFKDVGGPSDPPGRLTPESFEDPDARLAAAAIAVSFRGFVKDNQNLVHLGARDAQNCVMDISRPAYSGNFAFIGYSEPGGRIGVYVFRKGGSDWSDIEHKVLGAW